ncbi:MAG: hypothetical protein DDT39_00051 [Firmicutes bacterium]|nr:hypothetical protein [candidate division NPL-UPA2 bacterium]
MHIENLMPTAGAELARAYRNHKYEVADTGVLFPRAGLFVGGAFRHALNGGDAQIDNNLVVNEGLNYLLATAFGGGAQITQFFIAPFSANVTPAPTWTGANFTASATEFTAYAGATRLEWVRGTAVGQAIGNTVSPAIFTYNAGGPYNLHGMALLSASTKNGVTGVLAVATRFATPRLNQQAGDRLSVEYVLTAQDDGV